MIIGTCSSISHYTDKEKSSQSTISTSKSYCTRSCQISRHSYPPHFLISSLFLCLLMRTTICLFFRVSSLSILTSDVWDDYHNTTCRYVPSAGKLELTVELQFLAYKNLQFAAHKKMNQNTYIEISLHLKQRWILSFNWYCNAVSVKFKRPASIDFSREFCQR